MCYQFPYFLQYTEEFEKLEQERLALEATIKENDFEEGKSGICGFFRKASSFNFSKHETKKGKFQNDNFFLTLQHFHQCANWTLTLSQKHRRPCNRTYPMQSCLGGHNHVTQNRVSVHCWQDMLPHTTQPICIPPTPSPGHLLEELSFC